MRVLVFPHDLNMGGSQMNAIELAAAVRDLGHECIVFGRRGGLCEKIDALGLEFVEAPRPSHRPTPGIVRALRELIRRRGIDIVHGYEWPPALEGFLATRRTPARPVGTIMSMAVAPFLPKEMPLIVGTRQIAAHEKSVGRHRVDVLEPPIDLQHNQPPDPETLVEFKKRWHLGGRPLVVCVSRLAHELKAEGILSAINVAGIMASTHPFQLLVVGDGPARAEITDAADRVNRQTGSNTVVLTGELLDPRPAYAIADVSIGMGGSALRALAFAKPLIVQGENGFFRTLTAESLESFQWQGWYGVGRDPRDGRAALVEELTPLLENPAQRASLGGYSRGVAQLFSLETAAREQVRIYEETLQTNPPAVATAIADTVASGWGFAGYFTGEQVGRVLRRNRRDDFNAQPVAAVENKVSGGSLGAAGGPVVYLPGVRWDTLAGTDRNLALALSRHTQVIWVEVRSIYRNLRHGDGMPRISHPAPNITRLCVSVPPGLSRPLLRNLTNRIVTDQVRHYLRKEHLEPSAVIAATTEPRLSQLRDLPGVHVYFATDDFVAGADLLKRPLRYLLRSRERNLGSADLVLAVTAELARDLQRGHQAPIWFPNGADLRRYDQIESATASSRITLRAPIVGVVGQFNERTDFRYLRAIQSAGLSLLLIGPRFLGVEAGAEFDELIGRPGVQWIDQVPPDQLPEFMCAISVGLTPYADTVFNRRSYPLKTLEYLSAGIPVVSTTVPPLDGFDPRFVRAAEEPSTFVQAIRDLLIARYDRATVRSTVAGDSWDDRARQLLDHITAARERTGPAASSPHDAHADTEEHHAN